MKTLHIFFVIAWLGCLFVLPRALLHWKMGLENGSESSSIRILSIKLFRFGSIMAFIAIGLGLWLWFGFGITGTWLHVKIGLVGLLIVYHVVSGLMLMKAVKSGSFPNKIFLRVFNETPILLLLPIIYLVVAKPL
ncbi:CopD family protein [Aurantivibrio infirmus]